MYEKFYCYHSWLNGGFIIGIALSQHNRNSWNDFLLMNLLGLNIYHIFQLSFVQSCFQLSNKKTDSKRNIVQLSYGQSLLNLS